MPDSNVVALGTTPCWSGCIYAINPAIQDIEPANESKFDRTSDEQMFEQEIE